MHKSGNGPAFPFLYHNETSRHQKSFAGDHMVNPDGAEQYGGMSLRAYMATKFVAAMVSTISCQAHYDRYWRLAKAEGKTVGQWFAHRAVHQADDLIAELTKDE